MLRIIKYALLKALLTAAVGVVPLAARAQGEKSSPASSREAEAQGLVLAALRAELEGDNARRSDLLQHAVQLAPEMPEANWHLARVRSGGKWLDLATAEKQASDDPQWAEYQRLRSEIQSRPKLVRNLARWCVKAGWDDTARLHYAQLLTTTGLDGATIKEALGRLDLHQVGGQWLTGEELKIRQQRSQAVEAALQQWRPRLKRLQLAIDGTEHRAREAALKDLHAIDNPQSIAALESFQLDGGDRFCEEAARRLGSFPQLEATEALARFAVLSPFAGARDAALAALKTRPKHDYLPLLLGGLTAPIKTQFAISVGRNGTIHYTHALAQESPGTRLVDVRDNVASALVWQPKAQRLDRALPSLTRADMVLAAVHRTRLAAEAVEAHAEIANEQSAAANRRVFEALESLTEAGVPRDANQWWQWWQDYNQYYWPQQTVYTYQQRPTSYVAGYGRSCFTAGTPVRTHTGLRPIESIQPSDRVLAQDQDTGELAYKVVLRTTTRPPAKMVRICTAGDQIETTLGHPFWVVGSGWKMAKELTAGDHLHSLAGAVEIESVALATDEIAYNLVVDDFNSYFVGQGGLLVHDNEFRRPTRASVPGLAVAPTLAAK